jgi:hypothetical protein
MVELKKTTRSNQFLKKLLRKDAMYDARISAFGKGKTSRMIMKKCTNPLQRNKVLLWI